MFVRTRALACGCAGREKAARGVRFWVESLLAHWGSVARREPGAGLRTRSEDPECIVLRSLADQGLVLRLPLLVLSLQALPRTPKQQRRARVRRRSGSALFGALTREPGGTPPGRNPASGQRGLGRGRVIAQKCSRSGSFPDPRVEPELLRRLERCPSHTPLLIRFPSGCF